MKKENEKLKKVKHGVWMYLSWMLMYFQAVCCPYAELLICFQYLLDLKNNYISVCLG